MADITISHTCAEGTLIDGSAKGDGVYEILKGLGTTWRYMPSIQRIGLSGSRDRAADTWRIRRAAEALRAAGHTVTVSADDSKRRDMAEIEADRAERAGARAERLGERAERRGEQASADYERARQMAGVIPLGQPMMPDHYSYGRDRRYRERIDRTYKRAFGGMDEARELQRRAQAAEVTQSHRESVPATQRRIEKLEAGKRRIERAMDVQAGWYWDRDPGHDSYQVVFQSCGAKRARQQAQLDDVNSQITYWRGQIEQAKASGVKVWGPSDFTKGDYAQTRWGWAEVLRVSAKSVSVAWDINSRAEVISGGDTEGRRPMPYDKITGRKSAEEMAAMLAGTEQASA